MSLKSEQIIIEAPMSFTGAARRLWRLSEDRWVRAAVLAPILILIWFGIACWYLLFGVLLIPYRLIRRNQRVQKRDALRHRELLG